MHTTYRLKANELDERIIKNIRSQFGQKLIRITVSESDETDYLLQNEANREKLEKSLKDAKERRNLHTFDLEDIRN